MSGEAFDCKEFIIEDIADRIDEYLEGVELDDDDIVEQIRYGFLDKKEEEYIMKNKRTIPNRSNYSNETLDELKLAVILLRLSYLYAKRVAYLLSGDDGEESFIERLKEDIVKFKEKYNGNKWKSQFIKLSINLPLKK